MRATESEFRYRSLIILVIYFTGLSFYRFDHANVVSCVIDHTVGRRAPNAKLLAHALFGIGALLVFLAAGLRTWAAAYLQSNTVQDPTMHLDAIVADGPYRHLRNPLYLGAILLAFGIGLLASTTGFLFITICLTILFLRLTGLEEAKLAGEQGESLPRVLPERPSIVALSKAAIAKRRGRASMAPGNSGRNSHVGILCRHGGIRHHFEQARRVVDCRYGDNSLCRPEFHSFHATKETADAS